MWLLNTSFTVQLVYIHACILVFIQRLQEREAVFSKLSYNEKDREKWKKVFQVSFMSSEESENDGVIEVRPLPWRSDRVTTFLHSLDEKAHEKVTTS